MTQKEQIAALKSEVTELREQIASLTAAMLQMAVNWPTQYVPYVPYPVMPYTPPLYPSYPYSTPIVTCGGQTVCESSGPSVNQITSGY